MFVYLLFSGVVCAFVGCGTRSRLMVVFLPLWLFALLLSLLFVINYCLVVVLLIGFWFAEACRVLLFVEHLLCICLFPFEGSFGVLLVVLLLFVLLIDCFNSNSKFGIVFYYVLLGIGVFL